MIFFPTSPCFSRKRVDLTRFERLGLSSVSDDADASLEDVELQEVLPVAFRECDEMVEHVGLVTTCRVIEQRIEESLRAVSRVETAMHVQDRRNIHPSTDAGADLALRLPIAMGVNNVEPTALQRRNDSRKESIVSDVDIASEAVYVHTIHHFGADISRRGDPL